MKPIRLNALAKMLSLETSSQTLVKGVAIDSRLVKEGDLFFALSGKRVDGHNFLPEAVSKGAAAAVVLENYEGKSPVPLLSVPDVLDAFQTLAHNWLKQTSLKVVAITGTLGKTTTKEFVTTLLKSTFRVAASPRSYNSQATLPLSILSADGDEEILVLEMAMTHPGQIEKLVGIAPPDVAVLTNIAVQHACNFSDGLAGICREKAAIFSHPKTKLGIVHRDAMHFEEIVQTGKCPKTSFSMLTSDAEYFLEAQNNSVTIYPKGESAIEIPLNLPLKAYYHNFLAAVAVARHFQVPWEAISLAANDLKLPPMRFEKVEKKGILFINDAYNANPDSMKAALESLPKPVKGGKTIAVLGQMTELGMYSEAGHALVAETALQSVDLLLCLGERCEAMRKIWKREKRPVELFETRAELEEYLKTCVQAGDVVLLKGARPLALEEILNGYD